MSRPLRRFTLFALAAIVLPAAIVAVLGYVSLRQWERSADILFREQAREMASMAADKVEMVWRRAEDDLLTRLQATLAQGDAGDAALDGFLATAPMVERLYLFDRQGRLHYPRAHAAEDAEIFATLLAQASQRFWDQGGRRHLVAGDTPILAAILRSGDGGPILAALTETVDGLGREVFDKTLGDLEGATVIGVIDHRGRSVWSREAVATGAPILTVPLHDAFPNWRLALYQPPGASPRESVRRQVAVFTAAFGLLLLVIVAGLVATYRLVQRETEMARLKADFVANVSHDLKTPLSVIRMFGETLEMGRVESEATRQDYYRVITRESERLSRLIDNVLDFSRIEGGRRRYDPVPTAVEPLIRETLEAFSYPLTQQGFKVDVRVAPDLPEIPLDADAVTQALGNLIDNAIKYSGERRALRIEAGVVGGELAVTVADEGIGIPREEQARIFDKFYRVGRSETQGRRGSGVGLALVRHVAEAHGGRVTVESRPGEGSRFALRIPLAPDGAPRRTA